MAHGGDLFALGADIPSERNFELAFRGYKPDQVDKCIRLLETENTGLAAERDVALTSRNALLPLRRALARRWPDLMRSGGGSANAILVRGERIAARTRARLRLWPERRVVQAVRLAPSGVWVANLHAQVHSEQRARADLERAAANVARWAGDGAPIVLGGDLNVRRPAVPPGLTLAGGHGVDHVLVRGLRAVGEARVLERGGLSDHAPVLIEVC